MRSLTHALAARMHRELSGLGLVIWTVTTGTSDFGDLFTARPTVVPNPRPIAAHGYLIADDLDGLRALLPSGLTRLPRYADDDPVVVEVWL